MRASGDRLAAGQDGVRASDAERDQAIGELRDRFAEGRLSQDTFLYRMDAALRAKNRAELSDLFADLPHSRRHRELRRDEPARGLPNDEPAGELPSDEPAGGGPGGPADGHAGLRRLARRALNRLARVRRPADWLGAGARRSRPAHLCLPPEAEKKKFTIGRELACDFTLPDLSVSRWHARLYLQDGRWILSDLGSTNGTRLNGWRVTTSVRVQPGDRVSFGAVSFVLTDRPVGAV